LKATYLVPLAYAALFFACASSAQSPPAHQDTPKGNDLVGNPQPPPADPLATPSSTGQDKSTGNDLVSSNEPPTTHQDTTKGSNLVGSPQPPPADPLATPPTSGQDKSTGNDLVAANDGQTHDSSQMRPDFDTLDTGKKGYLTAHNVKTHHWLSKNFAKCDLNHDHHLTQDEYANCHP